MSTQARAQGSTDPVDPLVPAPDVPHGRDDAEAGSAGLPAPGGRSAGERRSRMPGFVPAAVGIAALIVIILAVREIQDIVAPVFLALNLVIIVYPLQAALVRARVPAAIAAAVTVTVVLVVLAAFFGSTGWAIAELVLVLPNYAGELNGIVQSSASWLSDMGLTPAVIEQQLAGFNVGSTFSALGSVLSNTTVVVTALATIIMAVFFVAMDSMSIGRRLELAAQVRPGFAQAMTSFGQGVRRYWIVATIFGLIVAVLDVIALQIIGVPLALAWGVLAFLTNYIPNVGFVIGLVPPALMALIDLGWVEAVWVIAAYSVLNFVIQAIIQPKFTGQSVGVTPFVSFASLLFWYWVLGGLGALLALPATLFLKALFVDADPRARWINLLISTDVRTAEVGEHAPRAGGAAAAPQCAGLGAERAPAAPAAPRIGVPGRRLREVIVPFDGAAVD